MRVEDDGERSGWELVLVETAKQPVQSAFPDNLFDQSFTVQNQYNPFLQDAEDHAPTANPTTMERDVDGANILCAEHGVVTEAELQRAESNEDVDGGVFSENDPFGESTNSNGQGQMMFGSGSSTVANQQNVEHEQQLWLEIQNKIIAKHMSS
ncbi:hypothetical protein FNV43_RR14024 [Rhamnella rubrinervis]|uniref:Uncharacterized protein n=1 Tax=Rhamnella rubrinervis TaxID=2594499 RepID=A0A8K0MF65_9ROSA|nr:hypothetical protein FNV43_RR14024 [Rhamnella rubrinervis]